MTTSPPGPRDAGAAWTWFRHPERRRPPPPLARGLAAWVWFEVSGQAGSWYLMVPVNRDDGAWGLPPQAMHAALGGVRMELDALDDCVQRAVTPPADAPSAAEIAGAEGRT